MFTGIAISACIVAYVMIGSLINYLTDRFFLDSAEVRDVWYHFSTACYVLVWPVVALFFLLAGFGWLFGGRKR